MTDIESNRHTYEREALLEETLASDPIVQLQGWLDEAYAEAGLDEPNAMCVATVAATGRPSNRMVLLRGLDDRGLVFYTSYLSRKAREIDANPYAAATFFWARLERQVRVEGTIATLPDDESDAYFATRPRGHRLSAWASEQSESIDHRETLDQRLTHFDERFEGEEVPRPHSWGGYLIVPDAVEFWQGRANRMHDRLVYLREERSWNVHRLQP